jgi:TonB family protein
MRSGKMIVNEFADRFEELMQKAGVESCKTLGVFRPPVISSEDDAGSDLVTDPGATSPPSPPPPSVAPMQFEGLRLSGERNILPDDFTKDEIARSGKGKIVTSHKLCLSADGSVSRISLLKSSGFPAYDAKIQREMRTWRYRPYVVNGKASPVCTAVTYIYSQE